MTVLSYYATCNKRNNRRNKWIKDERGNKCSVLYFGSEEKAEIAIKSLKNCDNCINCSYCSYCRDCSDCSYCSDKKGDTKAPAIPKIENIHQKVLKATEATENSLDMDSWHTCETTHCRAGWVTTLAGAEGKALENYYGTCLAAQLIYRESSPLHVSVVRFFDTKEEAMDDIIKMAELEVNINNKEIS